MPNPFFDHPILNSPYARPPRHWELDEQGQPTQRIIESRRRADFITPIPKPKKRTSAPNQKTMVFDEGLGLSTATQAYDPTSIINELRQHVDQWRALPNPNQWQVTPETARLLQHWRHHNFSGVRPFFCQVEAVETAIWLTEVAPQIGRVGEGFLEHLASASNDANPDLMRLALKLATDTGKTTVMAMLIAWQTINPTRHRQSKRFTRGFLVVAPGLTIKDRLRVLQPMRHAPVPQASASLCPSRLRSRRLQLLCYRPAEIRVRLEDIRVLRPIHWKRRGKQERGSGPFEIDREAETLTGRRRAPWGRSAARTGCLRCNYIS